MFFKFKTTEIQRKAPGSVLTRGEAMAGNVMGALRARRGWGCRGSCFPFWKECVLGLIKLYTDLLRLLLSSSFFLVDVFFFLVLRGTPPWVSKYPAANHLLAVQGPDDSIFSLSIEVSLEQTHFSRFLCPFVRVSADSPELR